LKPNQSFEAVYDFANLYAAYRAACKGKRWKSTVAKVEANALEAVSCLQNELREGTYRPGAYYEFFVYEPKKRLIQTNSIKDKIVQHAFCDQVLYPVLSRPFILDNYGSQVGKGTHFGLDRLRDFMREYYRRHGSAEGWVLKADVHHYFASIRHDILKQDVAELLTDPRCLALSTAIIDSTPGDVGIPIGNQSSQIYALLYLNKLDHFVKEVLRIRYYGRYMDDFYLIHEDKAVLKEAWARIEEHLAARGLELNGKTNIFPLRNGLDFLGFHTYLTDTGKVIRKVRRSSRERMKRKLRKFAVMYEAGTISKEEITASYQSWRSHAMHGQCRSLVQKYDRIFEQIFTQRSDKQNVPENQCPSGRGQGQRHEDQILRRPHSVPDRRQEPHRIPGQQRDPGNGEDHQALLL
jgi:retron-type reverse transcriptase